MNTKGIVAVVGLIIVAAGAYAYSSNQKQMAMMEQQKMEEEKMMMEKEKMEDAAMMQKNEGEMMENKDGAMMDKKDDAMMQKDGAMMSKGSYEMYDPSKLVMAEKGKVILFFRASWCPTCKALDADLKANMAAIPEGVHIYYVDYDNAADLKQKYGVTMQHTLVQVDAKGTLIAKWSGGNTLDSVVKSIK